MPLLPIVHKKIAQVSIDQLRGKNIYLNNKMFEIGNVIPDFSPYHKFIRHYKKSSLEHITKEIEKTSMIEDINIKSLKLGIISHYLSDYYCYPHFNNMGFTTKDIMKHINYERSMADYIEDYEVIKHKEYEFGSLNKLIDSKTYDYNNNKEFKEDIDTAISIVINLVNNIDSWGNKIISIGA